MKKNAIMRFTALAGFAASSCFLCMGFGQGGSTGVASRGSLNGLLTTRGLVSSGDAFTGSSTVDFVSTTDFTLRFSGFANPVGSGGTPFAMKLQFDLSGIGTVFVGDASLANGTAVTVPASLAKNGVSLKMTRSIVATQNVLAGSYQNPGVVVISQI